MLFKQSANVRIVYICQIPDLNQSLKIQILVVVAAVAVVIVVVIVTAIVVTLQKSIPAILI